MSWKEIPGWTGFTQTYDKFIASAEDGDTFVEIGVAFGRSLAYLAEGMMAAGKKVRIIGIDPWEDDWPEGKIPGSHSPDGQMPTWGAEYAEMARGLGGPYRAFLACMKTHAPEALRYVDHMRAFSYDKVHLFADASLKGVLIDGNHNYEGVVRDIREWLPKVKPGGILAGDDYCPNDFPGVVRAVHEVFGNLPHVGEMRTTFEWAVK